VVRTIDVHGADAQGAVPSTQPSLSETKVADWTPNPGGTGPPAGPVVPLALVVGVGVVVVDAGAVDGGVVAVVGATVVGATLVVGAAVVGAVAVEAVVGEAPGVFPELPQPAATTTLSPRKTTHRVLLRIAELYPAADFRSA
jgi:hypothetical protein